MTPFDSKRAPSPSAVLPFYGTAAIAFLVMTLLMLLYATSFTGHYFQPALLTLTHLAALGWGTMIIFGASHQLLPVVLEVHLYSERLAKWCFGLLLPGVILLATAFWNFWLGWPMESGALLVLSAFILYAVNVFRTARQSKKASISGECIVTASIWLVLTAVLGTLLVFNLRYSFFPQDHLYYLKLHAHLGMGGWFLLLVMGVGSRLIPMFLLSHHQPGRYVKLAYYSVNAALVGFLVMAFFFNTERYWPVFAAIAFLGILSYGKFVRDVYGKAMRKKLDTPMKITLTAIVLMVVPFLLLVILALIPTGDPQAVRFSLAYGISILGGFITAIILGQTFKTLPFIVWMHRYKSLIGKRKTPLPRELYRDRWVNYQFYCYLLGYVSLLAGVLCGTQWLITAGCACLFLTAICYNVNVFFIMTHRVSNLKKSTDNELSD